MNSIALFGGSFDPPHIGHEAIVKEILRLDEVDKVVIMPTYLNPFKANYFAPSTIRLKWLKKIFQYYKDVEIDSFEVDLQEKVPTIRTVKYLLKKYNKIFLVIGADNLASLHLWKNYNELKELVTFIVASRDEIEVPLNFLKIDVVGPISSTSLRQHIKEDKISPICAKEIIKFYKDKNGK